MNANEATRQMITNAYHSLSFLEGQRRGKVIYRFATTHPAISVTLHQVTEDARALSASRIGEMPLDRVKLWLNKNDARAYSIVGDPAVTLGN